MTLSERLGKLTGPDRDLGWEVLLVCGWRRTCVGHFYGPLYNWSSPDGKRGGDEDRLACPTESVDMALTLVPEGYHWYLSDGDDRSAGKPVASVFESESFIKSGRVPRSVGATPALALCVATLRVRGL